MVDLSEFDELAETYPGHNKVKCGIARLKGKLDKSECDQLDAVLAKSQQEVSAAAIKHWAARRDFQLSPSSVVNHRAGLCACFRV